MEITRYLIKSILKICITFFALINLSFAKEPVRLITLSPHLTELVYSAGAGYSLVGTVSSSDYPNEAKNIPSIGDVNRLNIEAILKLKPTHILAWQEGNKANDLETLKKLGIQIIPISIKTIKEIPMTLLKIGRLTNTEHIARRQANLFSQKVMKLEYQFNSRNTKKSRKKVFFEIWHNPIMTLNNEHIVSRIIQRCGGNNIFANIPNVAPTVSLESIRLLKPDVIFLSGSLHNDPNIIHEWFKYTDIPAVKNRRVYFIDPDTIERPTLRILEGYEDICIKLNY